MDSPVGNMTSDTSSNVEESWVQWFCNLTGNHFFCEVDRGFIEDSFNLFGLKQYLPKDYSKAIDMILDRLRTHEMENDNVSRTAATLYGLIHARYIVTSHGLEAMHFKFLRREFGECPRMYCKGQAVLPMGVADEPKIGGSMRLYCPRCQDVYNVGAFKNIDGCCFGPTFPGLFFMTYQDLVPDRTNEAYVPRIFGFKIHSSSGGTGTSGSSQIPRIDNNSKTRPVSSKLCNNNNSTGSSGNSKAGDTMDNVNSEITATSPTNKIIELREVSAADMASAAMKRKLNSGISASSSVVEDKDEVESEMNLKCQKI